MAKIINGVQSDKNVKVIVLHGGSYYSSGNELSALAKWIGAEESPIDEMNAGVHGGMVGCLMAMKNSVKPIVAVVSGGCHGIGFTKLSFADFIYCTPNANFRTPFMTSFQSPEGSATYSFPRQFGQRRANEVLLLDKPITAEEAVRSGFANGILP